MVAGRTVPYSGTSDRTTVLADAGREANEAPNLIALGRLVVGAVRKAMGADRVLVCTVSGDQIALVAAHGASAEEIRSYPVARSSDLPVCTVTRVGREVWTGPGSASEAVVPIRRGQHVLGTVVAFGNDGKSFPNDERAFLRALADAVAPAWARLAVAEDEQPPADHAAASMPAARRLGRDLLIGVGAPILVSLPFAVSRTHADQFGGWALQMATVVAIAWWIGRRASVIAAAVSVACVWFAMANPDATLRLAGWAHAVGLITYIIAVVVALVLVDRFKQIRRGDAAQRLRLETLVHDAPIGIAVFDRDLRFRAVNPTMAVMDDHSVQAHLHQRWTDLDPGRAALIEPYLAAVRDSGTAIVDEPLSLWDSEAGVERHWIVSVFPLENGGGDAEVAATFVDVTAEFVGRQRRLELLTLAETIGGLTRLDEVAQAAADFCAEVFAGRAAIAFVTNDDDLEVFATSGYPPEVNRRWLRARLPLGTPAPITDAARHGEVIEIPGPDALVRQYPHLGNPRLAGGEMACVSLPLRLGTVSPRPSGALHLSWTHPRSLSSASMETLRTIATLTETVALRLRVAEEWADERFKSALEAMTGTVAITRAVRDDDGDITDFVVDYMNEPDATTDRRSAVDFVGRSITELYPDWVAGGLLEQLVEVVETGVPVLGEGVPYADTRADGTVRHGYATFQVVKFDEGYLVSWHDVTDTVTAEQRALQLSVERSRREALDALAQLTTNLAAATTNGEVAEAVCDHAADAAGANFVGIALMSEPGMFTLRFSSGLDPALAPSGESFPVNGDSPFAVALRRGTPIEIEWLPDFVSQRAALVRALVKAELRSVSFVPLRADDDTMLGALAFAWVARRDSIEASKDPRVATVVDVVTTSLQRGAAEEIGRRRRGQSDALSSLAAALAGAVGLDDVWRIAASHVPIVFDARRVAIARVADDDINVLLTFVDEPELPEPWPTIAFPMDTRSPIADAVHSGRVVVVDDPATLDREYEGLPRPAQREWGGIAAVPVVGTERVLGVVGMVLPAQLAFDDHERNLLEFVGSLLEQAATRAQVYDRERARRRMIEAFQRAGLEMLTSPPLEPALAIARSAADILEATRFVLYEVDREALRLVNSAGYDRELRAAVPLEEWLPATDVVRRRASVAMAGRADWNTSYPDVEGFSEHPTLALPLHDQTGAVACVIVLGFSTRNRFPTGLLESLPEITAHWSALYQRARAAQAERAAAQREHAIAVSLQHAMLGQPDDVLHAEWAVAYKPADGTLEVGGDWYDLIDLSDDRIGLVVGDIVGHHLGAAAAMGQVRSAVRALAPSVKDPAELLDHVDAFIEHIEGAQCATIVYAVLDVRSGRLSYSCAGHLPPLLVSPNGEREFLLDGRNVPLGGLLIRPRTSGCVTIKPDQTLVLYSDGLIERPGESIEIGMERLADAAAALAPHLDAPALCNRLVADLLAGVEQRDDVAVLAVRPIPDEIHISRPADPATLRPTRRLLRNWLRAVDATNEEIDELVLSVGEALTNAIEHSAPAARNGAEVFLDAVLTGEVVTITIRDSGRWRTPTSENSERGRGLHIMRAFNDVNIVAGRAGTTVELSRRLRCPRAHR